MVSPQDGVRRNDDRHPEPAAEPGRPPHGGGHRGARQGARRDPPGRARVPRRRGRGVHPPGDQGAAQPRARQPRRPALLEVEAGLADRHHRPRAGQDPRQHGDRPQRPARPVGLDARPADPLLDVGVGPRGAGGVLEALAQRVAPRLHEHPRQGQRPRLRHPARRRGPAVEAPAPRPAAVERDQRGDLRVRRRDVRPRARRPPAREARHHPGVQGAAEAGRCTRSASRPPRTTSCTRRCPGRRGARP